LVDEVINIKKFHNLSATSVPTEAEGKLNHVVNSMAIPSSNATPA